MHEVRRFTFKLEATHRRESMIDYSRYDGHTAGPWIVQSFYQIYHKNQHGNFRVAIVTEIGDKEMMQRNAILVADAPLILEALKASEARVKELEKELTQPMLVNLSRLVDANADLKARNAELEAKLKARELSDDELYNIVS